MKKILTLTIILASLVLTACATTVTEEELSQGWYYGAADEQKDGTPEGWSWTNDGNNSKWIAPAAEQIMDY
jgi:hypothetical protein